MSVSGHNFSANRRPCMVARKDTLSVLVALNDSSVQILQHSRLEIL